MDRNRFDNLARLFSGKDSRRRLLSLFAAATVTGGLFDMLDPEEIDGAGRRKRRKKRHKHGKGRKREHQKHKKPKCRPLTTCPPDKRCGSVDDGCGGKVACGSCANPTPACVDNACVPCTSSDQCPSGTLCSESICQTCDVCAAGCPHKTVQAAVTSADAGETIYVCAGTYGRQAGSPVAVISKDLTIIGAGTGKNGTIFDGGGTESYSAVVQLQDISGAGSEAELHDLTVTGGNRQGDTGGIEIAAGTQLTLTRVLVTGNTAAFRGGGIGNFDRLVLNAGTEVTNNTAGAGGGGILNLISLTVKEGASITNNDATGGVGGGILNKGTVTLETGSDLSGNEPDQCVNDGGTGCPA